MLYIKFKILTPERFIDFQELYKHMLEVRLPGFEFEDKMSKVNWERITQDEIDIFLMNHLLKQQGIKNFFQSMQINF